ncbi:VPS34 [[Candida] subhashii]|uniref:Phosphatidylinositol 3-kinase VPS34 n=1 Tax=[Candida] subhashii TaxID=561895 RepID=A0A8J5QZX4_9ASCO|nr:VPS34 [[Candida] subhashii]KAG7664480.1 VPS34 [[Candida] subhashii]
MTTIAATTNDSLTLSNTFGLSKDLSQSIIIKICYLQPTATSSTTPSIVNVSERFEDPSVFKKLSQIHKYADLYVQLSIYDNNVLICPPVQTNYKHFTNNRNWNQHLKLSIQYNQISINSYLKFTIYEIIDTKPSVFGIGYLSLFNHENCTLRKGSQKLGIYMGESIVERDIIEYGDLKGLTKLEQDLIKFENGDFKRLNWLDRLVLPSLNHLGKPSDKQYQDDLFPYYLYVELPNFELPIVYSDILYNTVPVSTPMTDASTTATNASLPDPTSSIVINSIDIPMSTSQDPTMVKVYDPDFQISTRIAYTNPGSNTLDPIELKYHKLERNISTYNSILDKELKPTPSLRQELLKILTKSSNIELIDYEKNLIWKFRYYCSKNNSDPVFKSFLLKFLKSINWENAYELDYSFKEIVPNYWTIDKLTIGDSLELLGNYFNPFILGKTYYVSSSNTSEDSKLKENEKKFMKIFKNVNYLRQLAVERLRLANNDELQLYLLQLVQALKYEAMIYGTRLPFADESAASKQTHQRTKDPTLVLGESEEIDGSDIDPMKSPLAKFLIERSIDNEKLGNFFYWYVKVENEDQLNTSPDESSIYSVILNTYIESLKNHCQESKLPYYKHLKRQIWFIKKLTGLVELLRSSFKKNEATMRKTEFLKEYLANSSNELNKFPEPFPLPLDPSIMVCGCYPEESAVFKSSLAPLKITLKTVERKSGHHHSQIFGKRSSKHGKYPMMFKIGDDLRQDQLVIQIIDLMDQLLKNENLDLKLTPYKILATSPVAGLIQFVPNETLDSILSRTYPNEVVASRPSSNATATINSNGILNYLKLHSQEQQQPELHPSPSKSILDSSTGKVSSPPLPKPAITSDLGVSPILMDNYVKSCAGYCVITYILGVGDRHLDNLLLSPNGKFWHADFGYILGRDPKPFPPLMKLPIQIIDGMGGLTHENYNIFKNYCFVTYSTLRKNSQLILNLFGLMLDANIPDIKIDPLRCIEKVQEKFCLEMSEEESILHFQNLINDSVNAFLPVVIDRLHSLAQYWRA